MEKTLGRGSVVEVSWVWETRDTDMEQGKSGSMVSSGMTVLSNSDLVKRRKRERANG